MVGSDTTTIKIGHALGARNEMRTIADEFRVLAEKTSISTPAMDRLHRYLDASVEPVADGSADLSVKWDGVWTLCVLLVFPVLIWVLWRLGDSPTIRLVESDIREIKAIVLQTASLEKARRYLEQTGRLGEVREKELEIDPRKAFGLRTILREG